MTRLLMTRLLLVAVAACGWAAALFAVWHVGRAFHEGYAEGFHDGEGQVGG